MSIQTQTNNYYRTAIHTGVGQNLQGSMSLELLGGLRFWSAIGKVFLVIIPIVLAGNLWLASAFEGLEARVQQERQVLNMAREENTSLQREKDRLLAPVRIQVVAAEKLSLRQPKPGQIQRM